MWANEEGATAVEYGLVVAGVAMAAIVAAPGLQEAFTDLLKLVLDTLLGSPPTATPPPPPSPSPSPVMP